jgi:hypothetical protein
MTNPWLKKNPWLSMWMSGANAIFGSARAHATAEARRHAAATTAEMAKQTARFWSAAIAQPRRKPSK